jgi:predicted extracellular nuclease
MLVRFTQDLVISEYFNFDRFGEIVLALPPGGLDRPFQPTSYVDPGSAEADDIAAAILERRILLDDGRLSQNPDPARHPNGAVFNTRNRFRGGDLVVNATGMLSDSAERYRIQPTEDADYTAVNGRPGEPADVGGGLSIATFSVLNYFPTVDSGLDICGPRRDMECRGADTAAELTRQRAKIVAALSAIGADVFGLTEMENTPGVEPLADLAAGLNAELGGESYAYVDTGVIGSDAVRVGFIYDTSRLTPSGRHAVLDTDAFEDPTRSGVPRNRPALAQLSLVVGAALEPADRLVHDCPFAGVGKSVAPIVALERH